MPACGVISRTVPEYPKQEKLITFGNPQKPSEINSLLRAECRRAGASRDRKREGMGGVSLSAVAAVSAVLLQLP